MAKVWIWDDEWYPVPECIPWREGFAYMGNPVDVPDEAIAKYKKAAEDFTAAIEEFREAVLLHKR